MSADTHPRLREYRENGRAARWSRAALFGLLDVIGPAPAKLKDSDREPFRCAGLFGLRVGLLGAGVTAICTALIHLVGAVL